MTLTPRELEIVRLLWDGLDAKAVARTLNRSPHTVMDYRKGAMRKLNVHSTVLLLRRCVEQGWITVTQPVRES